MTEVSTTLCRLGPSAIAVAHGTTLDSVIITIQGDGALHYCISRKVRSPSIAAGTSVVASFGRRILFCPTNRSIAVLQDLFEFLHARSSACVGDKVSWSPLLIELGESVQRLLSDTHTIMLRQYR